MDLQGMDCYYSTHKLDEMVREYFENTRDTDRFGSFLDVEIMANGIVKAKFERENEETHILSVHMFNVIAWHHYERRREAGNDNI